MTDLDLKLRHRELSDGLRRMARRTPAGSNALRSLLSMTVGPIGAGPSAEQRALLELAFAAAARADAAVSRKIERLHAMGAPRSRLVSVLQLAVLMSDGPALCVAADALARYDDLDGERLRGQAVPAPGRPPTPRVSIRAPI